ncbi:carbonic anhydrase [Tumebacillus avium]|uniref:carbonic anhydrase n=1 Tax=Tumebacillus avium TaxID=1903704 RepID=A0A1Y0IJ61_9BACL|nr:carbonic anhydrase [Tumebacillus avium]ARU59856.1 carbonic anhydrase [Tumebacillus avium]
MSKPILAQVLEANEGFVSEWQKLQEQGRKPVSKIPSKELAIFTCMDTRLVDFLEGAMGIQRGEAKVLKNAGNTLASPFGVVIRSLVMAIYALGVKEIIVIGHLDCGMASATADDIKAKMLARGISPDAIKLVEGAMSQWVDTFHHPIENVAEVVKSIRENPLIPKDVPVHGLIFDPENGKLDLITNGYEAAAQ